MLHFDSICCIPFFCEEFFMLENILLGSVSLLLSFFIRSVSILEKKMDKIQIEVAEIKTELRLIGTRKEDIERR
jgi:hypothetical protein